MIKNIKIFMNDTNEVFKIGKLVKEKFESAGFCATKKEYELAISIGNDDSFMRMVKKNNYSDEIYYVGINTKGKGFMQEIELEEINKLIDVINNETYKIEEIGIQKIKVNKKTGLQEFKFLTETLVRDLDLGLTKLNIYIDDYLLEKLVSDGVLITGTIGSTFHNLRYGGSIILPELSTLQITPVGILDSKIYQSINYSIVMSDSRIIKIVPENNDLILTIDGENYYIKGIENIETKMDDKKIKVLKLDENNGISGIYERLF